MKKLIFTILTLLTFTFAIAQDGINYQGVVTDANGDELTNQSITKKGILRHGNIKQKTL